MNDAYLRVTMRRREELVGRNLFETFPSDLDAPNGRLLRSSLAGVLREKAADRVIEAHDGPAALRLLERQGASIDLLFSDVALPGGMTGARLAAEARTRHAGIKVLFTTGYARDAIVHHGRLDPGVEFITKPFTYADLAARVRGVLDADTLD
jgi:CheY-like chemotaxis protein